MTDREQTRRDAEDALAQTWAGGETPIGPSIPSAFQKAVTSQKALARHCLALLTELEQAEAEIHRLRDRGLQRQTWSIRP